MASATTARERLLTARRLVDEVHPPLAAAARELGDRVIEAGLDALHDLYRLDGGRRPETLTALRGRGIYLSHQEAAVLRAHNHAFVPHSQLDKFYQEDHRVESR